MFESEIAINEFQLQQFAKTISDLPEDVMCIPAGGYGHPPVWILGHLAISGELGQRQLGGTVTHMEWLRLFGPGSSDQVAPRADLNRETMILAVNEAYRKLRELAAGADESIISRPHGSKLFEGTSIQTVKHTISLLLTNHFGFHLAQLSNCRRFGGHGPLF